MSANLENLAVATGLEKVHFHSNPKERQCQRMLKVKSLSRVRLFATLWTVAHQAPLSMKQISFRNRQESQLIYFKSWKMFCESAALNMSANLENLSVTTGMKRSVFIPNLKKAMPKTAQTTTQ